jgi:uncharacterized OB-fold protein
MTVAAPGRLVNPSLIDGWPESPRLVASRCRSCSAVTFPAQRSCARCTGVDVERHLLPTRGTLWGFTIQGFPPKTPFLAAEERRFTPYGVGYVDLGGEVLVESRLLATSADELRTGMDMELVIDPFFTGADGEPVLTFAFKPVA